MQLPILFISFYLSFANSAVSAPHQVVQENFRWVVKDNQVGDNLRTGASNNNLNLFTHDNRLYFAFRTADTHFASSATKIHVLSSDDLGHHWQLEKTFEVGSDIREPHFYSVNGNLYFLFCELGKSALSFTPKKVHLYQRSVRTDGTALWNFLTDQLFPTEMVWDIKNHAGELYLTSYYGAHYSFRPKPVHVNFRKSTDGINWMPVQGDSPLVYTGGVSEVSFEFDLNNKLWGITRLEDGDQSGWGSHVISAESNDYANWDFPEYSNPKRFDSPKLFRIEDEIYLVARRDVGDPFDLQRRGLPFNLQRWMYLIRYSFTKKRTALYWLNRNLRKVEWMQDLPSAGDTGFPSVVKISEKRVLVGNYTSPLDKENWYWMRGQNSKLGTQIYFIELDFTR